MECWYAVHTKPRKETIAEENLQRQSFTTFLPRIKQSRRRRGKWIYVVEPMFPRYLFVRLDLTNTNIAPIRSTCGVISLVMFGERIKPVRDDIINTLQNSVDSKTSLYQMPSPLFENGDEVNVVTGPFQGLKGVFHATTGQERVAILMDMLGRSNTVILQRDHIIPDDGRLLL